MINYILPTDFVNSPPDLSINETKRIKSRDKQHCIVCNTYTGRDGGYTNTERLMDCGDFYAVVCTEQCRAMFETNPLPYNQKRHMDSEDKTICIVAFFITIAIILGIGGCYMYKNNITNAALADTVHKRIKIQETIEKGVDPIRAYCAFNPDDVNCRAVFFKKNKSK